MSNTGEFSYEAPFTWSSREQRYKDANGNAVDPLYIQAAVSGFENEIKADITNLTTRLKGGEIELQQWRDALAPLAKSYRLFVYAMENGGIENAERLGFDNVSKTLRQDLTRLNDISQEVFKSQNLEQIEDSDAFFAFLFALGQESDGPEQPSQEAILSALNYYFHTSQEMDAIQRAACDSGKGIRKDEQRGALIWEQSGASHRVELRQEPPVEGDEEMPMDALEWLATRQNSDFCYALLYVCRLLAPPSPLPANRAAVGWVDLDDIALKIGYDLDGCTRQEREELRAQVWEFLRYGSRALVIGQRTREYKDKVTGEVIPTRIESPIWRVMSKERPVQGALFDEVPRRVELVISKQWEPLLTSAHLAQYLPLADTVAQIPTRQAAGAWARVIAPSLASFWRRHPRETMRTSTVEGKQVWAPSMRPTRREVLTHYTPKKSPPLEVLEGTNPKRAPQYWRDALSLLCESGFLAKEGEPLRTVAAQLEPLGRQGWKDAWLDERVDLRPGSVMAPHVLERAQALPVAKPKALDTGKRKRGRPRKQVA